LLIVVEWRNDKSIVTPNDMGKIKILHLGKFLDKASALAG
jgi:hypothetical protein